MSPAAAVGGLQDLLTRLRQRGIKLWLEDERLRFRAPKDSLTAALKAEIKARKAHIIEHLRRMAQRGGDTPPPLRPHPHRSAAPLSFAQHRLWVLDRLFGHSSQYNECEATRIEGPLRPDLLERSCAEIVRRHRILRHRFYEVEGEPVQAPVPRLTFHFPRIDLRAVPADRQQPLLHRLLMAACHQPFDLTRGPVFRLLLFRTSDTSHVFFLNFHHIVTDGWSSGVFLSELNTLYLAGCRPGPWPPQLPSLPIHFSDYARWQRQWLQGERLESLLAAGQQRLKGAPPLLELPTDRPRPHKTDHRGCRQSVTLPAEVVGPLRALSERHGVTLFMTLLAAWAALLSRWSDQRDLVIGSPIANRPRETEGLIGFFVNTLAMRIDLGGAPTFDTLLERVRRVVLECFSQRELPFEQLVEALRQRRNLSYSPVVQVLFALQNVPLAHGEVADLEMTSFPIFEQPAKVDLTLVLQERDDLVFGHAEYSSELFDRSRITRLLSQFHRLLTQVAKTPQKRLQDLAFLSPAERQRLLSEWNDTATPYPRDAGLPGLVSEQAARAPHRVALVGDDGATWSYGELERRARLLAYRLRQQGVVAEGRVAVLLEPAPRVVMTLLAILKAGAAYLPLDPSWPRRRLAFMVQDAEVSHLLGEARTRQAGACLDVPFLDLDNEDLDNEDLDNEDFATTEDPPDHPIPYHPLQLAYVMYTSGSTGRPKGVAVSHRAVLRLVVGAQAWPCSGPHHSIGQLSTFAFDAATFEVWGALVHGAPLVLVDRQALLLPERLVEALRRQRLQTIFLTTALFHQTAAWDATAFATLDCLLTGGEAVDADCTHQVLAQQPPQRLLVAYGPTENTTFTSTYRVTKEDKEGVAPLGGPISNSEVYVVDRTGRLQPEGVPGELVTGGEGLARGYFGRPRRTAATFVPNPWSGRAGHRLYKTGDLARQRADGAVLFLGRRDHQVKIRGFRIELGEVESLLRQHPDLRQAAVLALPGPDNDLRLVACYIPQDHQTVHENELRKFLRQRLPEAMLPALFLTFSAFPLTATGKIDREALGRQANALEPDAPDPHHNAPQGDLEIRLASLFGELLGRPAPGRQEDFFELGGHSLLATRLLARLRQLFPNAPLDVGAVFEHTTVAGLAHLLADGAVAVAAQGPAAPEPADPEPTEEEPLHLPLTSSQRRLWFLDRFEPESPAYHLPLAVEFRGPLDVRALDAALAALVARHEVLRTTFLATEGEPCQVISRPAPSPLPQVNLSFLEPSCRQHQAEALARREARHPFDLERGPLLRTTLLVLAPQCHILLFNQHHIISDGWSLEVLMRDLEELYRAAVEGRPSPLATPAGQQNRHFTLWQQRWLGSPDEARQERFWMDQLTGTPVLELPTDHPRPAVRGHRGRHRDFRWPRSLAADLKGLGARHSTTSFMSLVAVTAALLHRLTGQPDFALGTVIANRHRPHLEDLVGFLANTLVLRLDLGDHPSLSSVLAHARSRSLAAYAHQDLPFERLVERMEVTRDARHTPLFQVLVTLQNAPDQGFTLPGLTTSFLGLEGESAKFDLSWTFLEQDGELLGQVEFLAELFDRTTIERWIGHLETLVRAAVAAPTEPLSCFPLLTPGARHQLLVEWNAPAWDDLPTAAIHQHFAAQVVHRPQAVALVTENSASLTYGALEQRVALLRGHLHDLGIGAEDRVGLLLESSPLVIEAMLAILAVGAVYVPLDPSHPVERLVFMLRDSGTRLLLSSAAKQHQLGDLGVRWLDLAALSLERPSPRAAVGRALPAAAGEQGPPAREGSPHQLAYIMYTSGSTGQPKGVAVRHSGVLRLALGSHLEISSEDAVGQGSNLSFDAATYEIWVPLLNGARLVLLERDTLLSAPHLTAAVRRLRLRELFLTTSLLHQHLQRPAENFGPLKRLVAGGEALDPEISRRALRNGLVPLLINGYGPTECTTFATWHAVRQDTMADGPSVPIGRPIANTAAYVVDRHGRPVPCGIPGELWIGGQGLARAYHARPALTAERFLPNPFAPAPGDRLYRTGDRVRARSDGSLEFLGRFDNQVKIRGFRVEPGEVQQVLAGHPAVRQAVVTVRTDATLTLRLVAWVVAREDADQDTLVPRLDRALRQQLPAYLVPAEIVLVETFPLTPNGKIDLHALDQHALPDPNQRDEREGAAEGAQGEIEEHLARLFAAVLKLEGVGRREDFFALGGHSLLATLLLSRLQRDFPAHHALPLRMIFEEPTVAGLARRLTHPPQEPSTGLAEEVPFPTAGNDPTQDDTAALSFAQERLWFLDQMDPGKTPYNLPGALRLRGTLHRAVLAAALHAIVRRHQSLRTTFSQRSGEPFQRIHPQPLGALHVVDLTRLPQPQREARNLLSSLATHPFHLATGPLLRSVLLHFAPHDYGLFLDMHHIISDGWSMGVLTRELSALYSAGLLGTPSPLPPLPLQYAEFARWQRRWLQGAVLERQLTFWRRQLADLRPLELPCDRPRPAVQSFRGNTHPFRLPATVTGGLRALARRHRTTLFTVLLGAFQTLLSRYAHEDDLAVGTPVANRNRPELEALVGFFVNTLVLRGELRGDPPFDDLLERLRPTVLEALMHQDVPFERLVMELSSARDQSRSPLFQVMLTLENTPFETLHLEGLTLEPLAVGAGSAKFDLTLAFSETPEGGLSAGLEHNLDLFDPTTAQHMAAHFQTLLQGLLARPGEKLSALPLLTPAERHTLLTEDGAILPAAERGGHHGQIPSSAADTSLPARFAARLPAHRERIAWDLAGHAVSYNVLDRQAQRLAQGLLQAGVGREELVALCLPRSADLPIAILGILQAGAAYVPLDPSYPQERLATILEEAQIQRVVTSREAVDQLPPGQHQLLILENLLLDGPTPRAFDQPGGPTALPHPDQLAYVIYTSGSTGRPKGVAITHRNVLRLFDATDACYHFGPEDVWPLFHSFAFDVSVWEMWGALLHGGRLLGVPYLLSRSPEDFYRTLTRERVTVLNQTPSAFRQLTTALPPEAPAPSLALRWIVFAGEALDFRSLRPWKRHHGTGGPRLANMYGITETTVHVTFRTVEHRDIQHPGGSFVGPPMADLQLFLVDRRGRPVPLGVPGDLHVGGPALARGYLRRPGLTATRFLPNPFSRRPGARLYRSGDLARRRGDGELEYLGRIDQQVKVRGFRIELGDLEARLMEHDGVAEAVALARPLARDDDVLELIAWVVLRRPLDSSELRQHLRQGLPDYMLPAHLLVLAHLPMTRNGKVDRAALPNPTARRSSTAGARPRTPTEAVLAEIFGEVLGQRSVGIDENFFALGGHSLKVTRAVSRIQQRLQVKLGLREVFAQPTVQGLAAAVAAARRAVLAPIPRLAEAPDFEPSHAQRRLWILGRLAPHSIAYNMAGALRLRGPLDAEALANALQALVERHEALRTTFPSVAGEPRQRVLPAVEFSLESHDFAAAGEAAAQAQIEELAQASFDLERDLLFRAQLLRLAPDHHLFAFNMHHIVSDGWSLGIMERELAVLYRAAPSGSELPAPALQYRDFAAWQNRWLASEAADPARSFWQAELAAPLPVLELPNDRPHQAVKTFAGRTLSLPLGGALEESLHHLALEQGASLFMVLVTAVATLLHQHSGQRDLILGSPVAGRDHPDLEAQIGFYVNSLPLRVRIDPTESQLALLGRVRDTVTGALEHGSYPFDLLVEELEVERDPARSPIFEIMVALQNQEASGLALEGIEVESVATHLEVSRFELTFNFYLGAEGLGLGLEYNSDLFDTTRILRLGDQLRNLLHQLTTAPAQALGDISLQSRGERHQLLREWNDSATAYPRDLTLHGQVAAHARAAPHRIALEFGDHLLSYGELVRRARRLAALLRGRGLEPEEPVALFMERSLELIISMLGILEAGGAYLPLDPNYPAERLRFMIETLHVRHLLSQERLLEDLPVSGLQVLAVDTVPDPLQSPETQKPARLGDPLGVAYVMFTSGSTGHPKGVRVLHRGITRLVRNSNFNRLSANSAEDPRRHLHFATIAFDASTEEIWSALLNGASLAIFPPHLPSLEELGTFITTRRLTYAILTTSLFIEMISTQPQALQTLRALGTGGDVLPVASALAAATSLPFCRVVNLYGPTEASVAVTFHPLSERVRSPVPIGRVLSNNQVYLLNRHLRPVPLGVAGELFLGGDGLARDYQGRPATTAEHFLPDPASGIPGSRLYKTGDLARHLADGAFEFLGRVDQQVKVSGFRIELGEIEAHLRTFPGLLDAVVIAPTVPGTGRRLVAFFTHEAQHPIETGLRDHLAQNLPKHMVPAHLLAVSSLPFTPNRKLDRAALNHQALAHLQRQENEGNIAPEHAEPRAGLEQQLAAIWREVLGVTRVGVDDNFFDLGGHSLAALKAHERIRRDLGKDLPLVKLFEHPTLAALARHLSAHSSTPSPQPEVDPRARGRSRRQALQAQRPQRRRPRRGRS